VEGVFTEVPICFNKNAKKFRCFYCGMKSSILSGGLINQEFRKESTVKRSENFTYYPQIKII